MFVGSCLVLYFSLTHTNTHTLSRSPSLHLSTQVLNSVILQELVAYNALLSKMRDDLSVALSSSAGLFIGSHEMQANLAALKKGEVPRKWVRMSCETRRSLASWIVDLGYVIGLFCVNRFMYQLVTQWCLSICAGGTMILYNVGAFRSLVLLFLTHLLSLSFHTFARVFFPRFVVFIPFHSFIKRV